MSAWTDSLRAASFRGVPFETSAGTLAGGRRTVLHEVVDADRAVTEDTGRRTRTITLEAFVLRDSPAATQAAVSALIAALEAAGPGRLVHPLHGDIIVSVDTYQQTNSWADGSAVGFQLSFVESGLLDRFGAIDLGSAVVSAYSAALAAVEDVFDALYAVEDLAGFVLAQAEAALTAPLDDLLAVVDRGLSEAEDAAQLAADIRDEVAALPSTLSSFAASTVTVLYARVGRVEALLELAGTALGLTAPTYTGTPSERQAARNAYQARRLGTRAAICEAAEALRATELGDYATAVRWRDTLAEAIASEVAQLTEDDAQLLEPLRALAGAMVEDVTRRAAQLPRATRWTPPGIMPSLVIAWQLYRDPDRAAEVVERNGIVHPGFVPAEELEVLAQ